MLDPALILQAYRAGLFPMAPDRRSDDLRWYDPDPRGVLPLDRFHVPKRLQQRIRQKPYAITADRDFAGVIKACADTRQDTWINDDIIATYAALHGSRHAHSVEAWTADGKLAGGVYGVSIGGAFFGESMFSVSTDASKIALVYLAARLWRRGFILLDTQFINNHLLQFGAIEITRAAYHQSLARAVEMNVTFGDQSGLGAGASAGVFSAENGWDADVAAFLQSITQTS